MLLGYNSAFAAINSRLVFVSNIHNTTTNMGTLILDLEAISSANVVEIDEFIISFGLDANFLAQNPQGNFSDPYFFWDPPFHVYQASYDFTNSTGEARVKCSFEKTFPQNTRKTIGESYQKIARLTIDYDLGGSVGSISWTPGYSVTDESGADITGILEPIPPELTDISLPVELSSFNAAAENDKVILTWTTQSEINNQGFEVYRSTREDGAYALIASYENNEALQGAGNSNTERSYRYEDRLIASGETYWYQIADVDYSGVRAFHGPVSAVAPEAIAERYVLHPNYPNPFNPETNIRFEISANAINSNVKLTVYNNLGMEIRTLINGSVEPGIHSLTWDGRNDSGKQMASGVYFLRLETGAFNQTRKMLLAR